MVQKIYSKGEFIRDKDNKVMCVVAKDIYVGDDVSLDQFDTWMGVTPKTKEQLIYILEMFSKKRVIK